MKPLLRPPCLFCAKAPPEQLANNLHLLKTGVKSFDVSLESQTATVVTEPSVPYDKVLSTIQKTGKTVNSGEADGEAMAV
jgi:copper chaperone CopZ